jgi:hypothetical protein
MASKNTKAEQQKELTVKELQGMLARWQDDDSEFRNYTKRRFETLKLIGAGNGTAMLAIAVFLTSDKATSGVIAGKWCFAFFAIGFASFMLAYRYLYRFESDLEEAVLAVRAEYAVTDKVVTERLQDAFLRSERGAIAVLWQSYATVAWQKIT